MRYTGISDLDDALNRLSAAEGRDEYDDRLADLARVAVEHVQAVASLYRTGSYERFPLVWCLHGQRNAIAIQLFKEAIRDRSQYVRWAAALGLVRAGKRYALEPMTDALRDRSRMVKGVAVAAMEKYGDRRALGNLKRILNSKSLRKDAPGIVESARRAIARIEQN